MGNNGNSVRLYFLGLQITADGDCSHELKRRLLLGRKAMTNLDSILKSRDVTLPTMVCLIKSMVFPVVMYGCGSWTIKKAEHWRFYAFGLWHWRRLLRVPWTSRRSNQSILKEISPEYSLEGLMLKLKLQYSGHLIQRADSFEMTLMLGKIEGGRRGGRDGWTASPTLRTWVWVRFRIWWWTGRPGMLRSMGSHRVGHDWATGPTDTDLHMCPHSQNCAPKKPALLCLKGKVVLDFPGGRVVKDPPVNAGNTGWMPGPETHIPQGS